MSPVTFKHLSRLFRMLIPKIYSTNHIFEKFLSFRHFCTNPVMQTIHTTNISFWLQLYCEGLVLCIECYLPGLLSSLLYSHQFSNNRFHRTLVSIWWQYIPFNRLYRCNRSLLCSEEDLHDVTGYGTQGKGSILAPQTDFEWQPSILRWIQLHQFRSRCWVWSEPLCCKLLFSRIDSSPQEDGSTRKSALNLDLYPTLVWSLEILVSKMSG